MQMIGGFAGVIGIVVWFALGWRQMKRAPSHSSIVLERKIANETKSAA